MIYLVLVKPSLILETRACCTNSGFPKTFFLVEIFLYLFGEYLCNYSLKMKTKKFQKFYFNFNPRKLSELARCFTTL